MNLAGEFFTEINDDKCPPGLNIYYIKFATVGNRGGGGAGNRTPFFNIVNELKISFKILICLV